jgi:hypothetical protein
MDELTVAVGAPPDTGLSQRAATVAGAVADVLDERCSAESGAGEAASFLRSWAGSISTVDQPLVSPLDQLVVRFDLSELECSLLLLAGLPDEHEGVAATFRSIHPQGEPRPTTGLAALLLGGRDRDRWRLRAALACGGAVRHGLLQLAGSGTFFERSLVLPEGLWEAMHGHDAWPADLPRVVLESPPPGLGGWLASAPVQAATALLTDDDRAVILITSDDEAVARARCAALAVASGRDAVCATLRPRDSARLSLLVAHAAVRGAVPVVVVPPPTEGGIEQLSFGRTPGTVIVCAEPGTVRAAPDRAVLVLAAGPVGAADQRHAWSEAVPDLAAHAGALAARHPLDPAVTAQLAVDAQAQRRRLQLTDISALIRVRAAASLPAGVHLVTPQVPWDHLVVPAEGGLQLRDAVARLDHQEQVLDEWGLRERARAVRGARLLLTGPPGTGKSLAAAAVATAARTDLLVVDVSGIVSKWLGETEKNLAAAFEAAERTQAVLLLDEADALFATRTEISDAHDRYANLETAYLLQRLDRFEGLAILTTNLRANIDSAFLRRMDFVVEFPVPDQPGRVELWTRHLPASALADDVDADALARLYAVPGAWIRNAAVAAAFGAAVAGGRITQQHLVGAMRREYAKASSPFPGEPPRRRHDVA